MKSKKPNDNGSRLSFLEEILKIRAKSLSLAKNFFNLNMAEAEDVAQEVCLSYIRNYENIENLDSWIFGATKRQSANYKIGEKNLNSDTKKECYDTSDSIIFLDLVQKLNKLCRRIIVYILFFGYTERETGQILNLKNSTLHNKKKECLLKLFKLYIGDRK